MSCRAFKAVRSYYVMRFSNLLASSTVAQYSFILAPFLCASTSPFSATLKYLAPVFNSSSVMGAPLTISETLIRVSDYSVDTGLLQLPVLDVDGADLGVALLVELLSLVQQLLDGYDRHLLLDRQLLNQVVQLLRVTAHQQTHKLM